MAIEMSDKELRGIRTHEKEREREREREASLDLDTKRKKEVLHTVEHWNTVHSHREKEREIKNSQNLLKRRY